MKIIKIKQHLTVVFEDETILTKTDCDNTTYTAVLEKQNDPEAVKAILLPELYSVKEEIETKTQMLEDINSSSILSIVGSSTYIESISQLSVPEDLATAIYKAEQEKNQELLDSYLNFWTLASLNPDSRARTNLFWFLKKYGMKISKSGLFVAYRNVELLKEGSKVSSEFAEFISKSYAKVKFSWKKSPKNYYLGSNDGEFLITKNREEILDLEYGTLEQAYLDLSKEEESPTYTDSHSRTFKIKIGQPVTMPREECDSIQENTCSRGLHVAGREWLQSNYFGDVSLMVLVNPADVVAVPPRDSYGKMRTSAYYPVQIVERDEEGEIIDRDLEDGFEDDFIDSILYKGDINNTEETKYTLNIPEIPELNKENILKNLDGIKRTLEGKDRTVEEDYPETEEDFYCDYCGEDFCEGECEE